MTRRTLLASALLAGCSRKLATRYFGWLFIASAADRALAVADLAEFRRMTTIPLDETPSQVLGAGGKVFVTCPDARTLVEIDLAHFKPLRKLVLPGRVVSAGVLPGTARNERPPIVLVTEQPSALCVIDTGSFRVKRQILLPDVPSGLDVWAEADAAALAVVASATKRTVTRIGLPDCRILGSTALDSRCGTVRFRKDGKAIVLALPDIPQVVTLDSATGALLARLPLAFAPSHFAANADGGQLFVTGSSQDTIAMVKPYQSEVDQTIIAGRTPYGMAVSDTRNMLLVTNPGSGDLTILDIETRKLAASVHIGGNPGEVLLTPDEEYALVIGRDAGDVSVVRMKTVLDKAVKTKPLFTVFAMGANPQSALILPVAQS